MKVVFHPEFPADIRKFEAQYARISEGLAARFRRETDDAVEMIKSCPGRAGPLPQSRIFDCYRTTAAKSPLIPILCALQCSGRPAYLRGSHSQPIRPADLAASLRKPVRVTGPPDD